MSVRKVDYLFVFEEVSDGELTISQILARWPNYHRLEIPTVATDTLDCGYYCTLHTRASIASQVVLTDKDLDTAKHTSHHPCLVHIIDVFGQDGLILQYFSDHLKPVQNLIIDIITVPVQCPTSSCFEF